jgi:prephenate dehydratase
MTKVAFQGVAGAYSEQAARKFFGFDVETIPCKTFGEIFTQVESSQADFGMLPIENAVAGSVTESYNLLMERDLRIHAEVIAHIHHMLMVIPGVNKTDIKRVRSHPQALAQCQRYLSRYGYEPIPAFDTAGSAAKLASEPNEETAVIASELASELYGLEIIDPSIEDYPFNYTRFFVLAASSPPRAPRNKTTLFFTTPHDPGALYECLGEFAKRRINLTKIESRPRLNQPWQYIFFLDFEGHCQDPECEAAIMGLLRRSTFVKLLGSYPAATTPVFEGQAL